MVEVKKPGEGNSIAKIVAGLKSGAKIKPLPVAEAARRLEVSPQTVYDWLAQGKLRPASLIGSLGDESSPGQALVTPVDPGLIERWNGITSETKNGSSDKVGNGHAIPVPVVELSPAAPAATEKDAERIVEKSGLGEEQRAKFESELGFLKGRITEMEKTISWERDARMKVESEISLLRQEKARLEGQIALSTKVEKSLQKYTDRLEQDLKAEREKKNS